MQSFTQGDPRTVTQNGPSDLKLAAEWDVNAANDIAHFLQISESLSKSPWFNLPVEISCDSDGVTSGFKNPGSDSNIAALTLIRQFMLPRDKVFDHALTTYRKFCDDGVKVMFVELEHQQFDSLLSTNLHVYEHHGDPHLRQLTTKQLIDLVVYGSGFFHRESNSNLEKPFSELLANCSRENVLFAFHSVCRSLIGHVFRAYPVIKQDFESWIANGHAIPSRAGIQDLFDDIAPKELEPMKAGDPPRRSWTLDATTI